MTVMLGVHVFDFIRQGCPYGEKFTYKRRLDRNGLRAQRPIQTLTNYSLKNLHRSICNHCPAHIAQIVRMSINKKEFFNRKENVLFFPKLYVRISIFISTFSLPFVPHNLADRR